MKQKPTARDRWYQKLHNERSKWRGRVQWGPERFMMFRDFSIDPRSFKLRQAVLRNRMAAGSVIYQLNAEAIADGVK